MEKKNTHIIYGLGTALAGILLSLVLHFADLSMESWSQYLSWAILLAGILVNALAYSKAQDGYVTFGQVFSSGFKLTAIYALIMIAWGFLSLMIFPEIKERAMDMAQLSMEQRGMPEEQIEKALEMTRDNFRVFMIGGIMFMALFYGAIFSLIGAAIAKKKGNPNSTQVQ